MKNIATILGASALTVAATFSLSMAIAQLIFDYMRLAARASFPVAGF